MFFDCENYQRLTVPFDLLAKEDVKEHMWLLPAWLAQDKSNCAIRMKRRLEAVARQWNCGQILQLAT